MGPQAANELLLGGLSRQDLDNKRAEKIAIQFVIERPAVLLKKQHSRHECRALVALDEAMAAGDPEQQTDGQCKKVTLFAILPKPSRRVTRRVQVGRLQDAVRLARSRDELPVELYDLVEWEPARLTWQGRRWSWGTAR